nr:M15 family metallopeptidase [Allomuricauda sp.]
MISFSIEDLSSERKINIRKCAEWSEDCPISLDFLKEVHFLHKDFSGNNKSGSIIVLDEIANSVLSIFKDLFTIEFPIHKAVPIDFYNGSDVDSMNDNNTSGFNCRKVMNEDRWSSHSYGSAIDINPVQNPYIIINHESSDAKIFPKEGAKFLNRGLAEKGMTEPIVDIFLRYGFSEWGGNWRSPLDYHHFQIPWKKVFEMKALKKGKQ